MRLGVNVQGVSYAQSDRKFRDLMTASSEGVLLRTQPTRSVVAIPDAQRYQGGKWPASLGPGEQTIHIPAMQGYVIPGTYQLRAAGKGTVQLTRNFPFGGGDTAYTIDIKAGQADNLLVIATDPTDPVRDVSLRLATEPDGLWTQAYLDTLKPFDTLRFLNWLIAVNASGPKGTLKAAWADEDLRPGHGIAGAVDLCNQTHCNGWFNLPYLCSTAAGVTDYPGQLGDYLARNLDPSLIAYLEYGNEPWNSSGPAFHPFWSYLRQPDVQAWKLTANQTYARLAHQALDAVSRPVDPQKGPRLRKVIGGQAVWAAGTIAEDVAYMQKQGYAFDCIASAPYFDWKDTPAATLATVKTAWDHGDKSGALDLVFQGLSAGVDQAVSFEAEWLSIADSAASAGRPVEHVCYECGPTFQAAMENHGCTDAMWAAMADPRMETLIRTYLEKVGSYAEMGNYFCDDGYGHWGARANLGDVEAPRWRAVSRFAAAWNER